MRTYVPVARRAHLHEVAQLVDQPQAAPADLAEARGDPPDQRIADPAAVVDLAPHRVAVEPHQDAGASLAVADAVRDDLVDGVDEILDAFGVRARLSRPSRRPCGAGRRASSVARRSLRVGRRRRQRLTEARPPPGLDVVGGRRPRRGWSPAIGDLVGQRAPRRRGTTTSPATRGRRADRRINSSSSASTRAASDSSARHGLGDEAQLPARVRVDERLQRRQHTRGVAAPHGHVEEGGVPRVRAQYVPDGADLVGAGEEQTRQSPRTILREHGGCGRRPGRAGPE